MNLLLDTNVCSAHLKRRRGLLHRFVQHGGGLGIPTIVIGDLYAWDTFPRSSRNSDLLAGQRLP